MTTQQQQSEPPHMMCIRRSGGTIESSSDGSSPLMEQDKAGEEMTNSALAEFRAKEEEIERRKTEVREKVQARLGRVEQEAKRLLGIRGELESLNDPTKKEVAALCKRIEVISREVKLSGANCQKKEREYKEAIEAFNERNKEKGQLLAKLVELVGESEKMRSNKLEELCKNI